MLCIFHVREIDNEQIFVSASVEILTLRDEIGIENSYITKHYQ